MLKVLSEWIDRYLGDQEAVYLSLLLISALVVLATLGQYLAPFIAAAIFAFMLQGMVNRLVSWKCPRLLAVIAAFTLFVSLLVSSLVFLIPLIGRQATNLVSQLPKMIQNFQETLQALPEKYPQLLASVDIDELIAYASQESAGLAETLLSQTFSSVPGLLVLFVYLFLVPLLVFFMLKDQRYLMDSIGQLLPSKRPVMEQIGHEMNLQIANYVRGKALEILIVGTVAYIWFLILGVDYALLLASLVGLSVIIPYIGVTVVTLPVALVGYLQWGWSTDFMWLMVAYGVIQVLDGNVLVPLLFSEVVNLHPVVIILAVLVFGGIWGFWGIFFAIPLATLVKALYNAWPRIDQQEVLSESET